ncbi:CBS domain-containing protein [Acidocella sp.]|uniref:CBS domain-containing protein n=1 Tax=Acidocella sp. TaxID=50710 RepID=UPI0026273A37|nr:CBS domain-containing protein [Acidocella sp.]
MNRTAAEIMTKAPLTVLHPQDRVPRIAAALRDNHVSAAPVVDEAGRLLGLVSESDLIRHLGDAETKRRAWWLELLSEGEGLAADFLDYLKEENRTAADVMKREVVTVAEDTAVGEIVDLFARHGIKRVPVLREGVLVGIVARSDIIRALAAPNPA